jgi:hypothetical protein
VLAARYTRERHAYGFFHVAKNSMSGSGSNKFCLAVLAWEKGTSRRAVERSGELV